MPRIGQRAVDGDEQQRAERGAPDRAAAAEDRHAADDDGGDGLELDAGAGVGADACRSGPRRATPARPASAPLTHERAEHPAADREAVEPGGVGVGADRVELAAAAVGVQVVADDARARRARR